MGNSKTAVLKAEKTEDVTNLEGVIDLGTILGVGTDFDIYTRNPITSPWEPTKSRVGSTLSICQMHDGQFLGVARDNLLQIKKDLNSAWVGIEGSGAVIDAIQLEDGKILGISIHNKLVYRKTLTSKWIDVPESGEVVSITQLTNGTILGVRKNSKELYTRVTLESSWGRIPYNNLTLSKFRSVCVLKNGIILGVGWDNFIYTKVNLSLPWTLIHGSGLMISVGCEKF